MIKKNLIKSFDYLIVINPYANISLKHLNISMQMVFGRWVNKLHF